MTKIFDAMAEMRASAITNGRKPRRWEINDAGLVALAADDRVARRAPADPVITEFLGIPIGKMAPGPARASTDPKVDLIVDANETREKA